MKIVWLEEMVVKKGLATQADSARVWPAEIEALTRVIERQHRQGIIADGQLMVFGISLAYKALNDLPDEARRQHFEEFCDILESVLFPTEAPSEPIDAPL